MNIFPVLVLLCLLYLLTACSTVPADEDSSSPKSSGTDISKTAHMDQQFQQAKTLFMREDFDLAAQLLLPLAQQGHLDAQYTIGYLYHYGQGVPRNEKEATRWITTAAARGHAKAKQALKLLDDYYGAPAGTPEDGAGNTPARPLGSQ